MNSMFFGHYLLETGAIDRGALLDAIERQRRVNRNLVEIALREGLVDEETAGRIVRLFRLSDATFADLLRWEAGLESSEIDRLVETRGRERLRIGEALVEGGYLSEADLEAHLVRFNEREERRRTTLDEDFNHLEDAGVVRICTELALRHLSRVTGFPVKLGSIEADDARVSQGYRRFAQNIGGDRSFQIAIDLGPELTVAVGRGMLGIEVVPTSGDAVDAGCELINLIGGNACTGLEPEGYRLRPEPPFSTTDSPPARHAGTVTRAAAVAHEEEFNIVVMMPPP